MARRARSLLLQAACRRCAAISRIALGRHRASCRVQQLDGRLIPFAADGLTLTPEITYDFRRADQLRALADGFERFATRLDEDAPLADPPALIDLAAEFDPKAVTRCASSSNGCLPIAHLDEAKTRSSGEESAMRLDGRVAVTAATSWLRRDRCPSCRTSPSELHPVLTGHRL